MSNTVEFFDFFVVGFILSIITVPWGLTFGQSAVILLAGGLRTTLGALFWGRVADRIGRRPAFLWTVATFSIATGLCAAVPEGAWLLLALLRVVISFGVGGLPVVDIPLISEFVPTKHRTRLAGLTVVFLPVGLFMGAQASALWGDTLGWRGLLLLGLVPVLLVFPIRLIVRESPRWLIQRGRLEEARANVAWYREIGAPIATLTRSAQRRWPWGSADPVVRARSAALARATIDHAAGLGADCLQVAGYFSFYEPAHASSRAQFVDGLRVAAEHAARRGVVLALENMDGEDVVSVQDALAVVAEVPAVRLHVDVGNLAANELPSSSSSPRRCPTPTRSSSRTRGPASSGACRSGRGRCRSRTCWASGTRCAAPGPCRWRRGTTTPIPSWPGTLAGGSSGSRRRRSCMPVRVTTAGVVPDVATMGTGGGEGRAGHRRGSRPQHPAARRAPDPAAGAGPLQDP